MGKLAGKDQDQRIFHKLHQERGAAFAIGPDVFLNNQSDISKILKTPETMGRDWKKLRQFAGKYSFFTMSEADPEEAAMWEKAHDAITPFFAVGRVKKRMEQLQSVISKAIDEYLKYNPGVIKLDEFAFFMAYATNARFLFGTSPDFPVIEFTRTGLDGALIPGTNLRKKGRLFQLLMNDTLMLNESHPMPGSLYLMIKAAQEREGFPKEWLRDQVATLLNASYETTQGLVAAAFYEAGQRPVWADRLRRSDPLDRRGDMASFLNETLRFYSLVPGIARIASEDLVVNGRLIQQGSRVGLNLFSMHRALWGTTADLFDPDRLDPDGCPMDRTTAILPFGDGPRVCIGQYLAKIEVALMLSEILKRYEIFLQDIEGEPFSYPATLRVAPGVSLILRPIAR